MAIPGVRRNSRRQRIDLSEHGAAVDLRHAVPARAHRGERHVERALGHRFAVDMFGDESDLAARMVGVGDVMLGEELDGGMVHLEPVICLEGGQHALAVERGLLAFLRRLHRHDHAERLVADRVDVEIRARAPGGELRRRLHRVIAEAGGAAEPENHVHVVVRLAPVAGAGDKPLLLGEILKNGTASLAFRRAVIGDAQARQDAAHMLVMLHHHRPDGLEPELAGGEIEEERVILGVPLLANGDHLFRRILADPARHQTALPWSCRRARLSSLAVAARRSS